MLVARPGEPRPLRRRDRSVIAAVIQGRWADLARGLLWIAALVLPSLYFRRTQRRAVELNSGSPAQR